MSIIKYIIKIALVNSNFIYFVLVKGQNEMGVGGGVHSWEELNI